MAVDGLGYVGGLVTYGVGDVLDGNAGSRRRCGGPRGPELGQFSAQLGDRGWFGVAVQTRFRRVSPG